MKRRLVLQSAASVLAATTLGADSAYPVLRIGSETGPVAQLNGYLHGLAEGVDANLVVALKPKFWRVGWWDMHVAAKNAGAKTQFVLSDLGNPTPWNDWNAYETILRGLVQQSVTGPYVDYWDLWNEPDSTWTGDVALFYELMTRTHNVIRSIDPQAKLVIPSTSGYRPDILSVVMDGMIQNNLRYDAISWHEFGIPYTLGLNVEDAKRLAAAKGLGPFEIHINEYASGQHHLIPGWSVAWLAALEKAGVQWANLACWNRESGPDPSECAKGLDGLLTADQRNTQAPYWVHKVYADMTGAKLEVTSPSPEIVALASKDSTNKAMILVLGKYSCGLNGRWCQFSETAVQDTQLNPSSFDIKIPNYPWSRAVVRVANIPYSNQSSPVPMPAFSAPMTYPVRFGTVTIPVRNMQDGSAKILVVTEV